MTKDDDITSRNKLPDRGKTSVRERKTFPKSPAKPSPYSQTLSNAISPKPLAKDKLAKLSFKDYLHSPKNPHIRDNVILQSARSLKSVKSSRNLSASDITDLLSMPPDIVRAMKKIKEIMALCAPEN